jgi:hypothetical protein
LRKKRKPFKSFEPLKGLTLPAQNHERVSHGIKKQDLQGLTCKKRSNLKGLAVSKVLRKERKPFQSFEPLEGLTLPAQDNERVSHEIKKQDLHYRAN